MRHATVGFGIEAQTPEEPQVVVGDVLRTVPELDHAPRPLRGIREIVSSPNYRYAARRYLMEMEARGYSPALIDQRMKEETPFTRIRLNGELAILPEGASLRAETIDQAKICHAALEVARRREVEGFKLSDPHQGWPRLLLLESSLSESLEIVDTHYFTPAHLLPTDLRPLFEFGP
jgi:hypothetical protein